MISLMAGASASAMAQTPITTLSSPDGRLALTIARRNGQDWYVGSITNWTPRDITLPLSFLGNGIFKAQIYEDGKDAATDAKQVAIHEQVISKEQTLHIPLAAGGGFAIRIIPGKGR
ncbi:glycoside hydrolase family 97 C-terminal domain-containing protein [Bryocella elongata]|uniref:glycoside hydrolase family 97 C-terminal domain-containing protein n=1 Tax=Bryocella elongata TaxID=863522 RepID=UPI001F4022E9|nr:glycoside hydrolase family 97 C-terminal domain-containing protein [Bryocella elongata]